MAEYSSYGASSGNPWANPNASWGSKRSPDEMHQKLLDDAATVMANRQRAAEIEAQKLADEQRKQDTDYMSTAGQGAAMGSAISPGWGTAIGAIAGGLLGMAKAANTRHNEGSNWWDAITKTMFDFTPVTRGNWMTTPGTANTVASLAQWKRNNDASNKSVWKDYQAQSIDAPTIEKGAGPYVPRNAKMGK